MMTLSRWKVIAVVAAAIFGVLFTLPNFVPQQTREQFPGFLQRTFNLGLDLQGGVYLLLEVDTAALRAERLTNLVEDVRNILRTENIPFSDLGQVGGQVTARINDPAQLNRAVDILRRGAVTQLPGGGTDVTVAAGPDQTVRVSLVEAAMEAEARDAVSQAIEIIRRRVDEMGTREPSITRQGVNRIVIQAPGESDPQRLRDVIGRTARLTFHMVDEGADMAAVAAGRVPPGSVVMTDEVGNPLVLRRRALVSGEMLVRSFATYDEFNRPAVGFRFDSVGARRFGDATRQNIGKRFAIVLDDRVISAPVIQTAILGGSGQITGNFTQQEVNDLVLLLNAGALPAPLNVERQDTVGAELGQDAVDAGMIATIVGFISILAFMVIAYGFIFGGVSVIALLINGSLILAIMSVMGATLTLPGIAGLILTLALAVDANVLIYERMRDEIRGGRPVITSMDAGFSRAMTTILDANITTLLAALIMFALGSGPVRGFAVTLSIGVFTSVFTAVLVTQVLLAWWFRLRRPKAVPIV